MNLREVVGVGLSVVELEEGADVFQAADVSKEADEDDVEVDVEVEVEVAVDGRGSREVKCEERLQVAQQVKFAIGSVQSTAVQSAALSPYSQPAKCNIATSLHHRRYNLLVHGRANSDSYSHRDRKCKYWTRATRHFVSVLILAGNSVRLFKGELVSVTRGFLSHFHDKVTDSDWCAQLSRY